MTQFVLLPSPVLSGAVWRPVASELAAANHAGHVAALDGPVRTPGDVLAGYLASVPHGERVVLVGHSNAGLYLPAVSHQRDVHALVFVDAAVPPAVGRSAPTASPDFLTFLAERADEDGLLPPWTQWWDEEDVAPLFPDDRTRLDVEAGQRRLPLSYFRGSVPVPEEWDARPCAYIAFGETYAAEHSEAAARGWPVSMLDGHHLEMLVHPAAVAAEILRLLAG